MPLKLNVGLSKKVGLPDYGSLGASCHVEVELEGSLIHHDLESFQRHVKNAYVACHQAVPPPWIDTSTGVGLSDSASHTSMTFLS
jgi:hypothetical protein